MGSLSTPGADEVWELFVQLFGEPCLAPCLSPQSCGPKGERGHWTAGRPTVTSGGWVTKPGAWPHCSEAMNPLSPSLTRQEAQKEKSPGQCGQCSALGSSLHALPAGPCTHLCFFPDLQVGSLAKLPCGILPPPSDHYLLPLFAPFTLFLLLVVGEGKVGHRDRPEFGGYDLSSPTPNQCISLSANTPCFCLLVSVPG